MDGIGIELIVNKFATGCRGTDGKCLFQMFSGARNINTHLKLQVRMQAEHVETDLEGENGNESVAFAERQIPESALVGHVHRIRVDR